MHNCKPKKSCVQFLRVCTITVGDGKGGDNKCASVPVSV